MQEIITLPGIGGSGQAHWQSHWEKAEPHFTRFMPASWDEPILSDWLQAVDREVEGCKRPPVVIAHSLACLLVAHWARMSKLTIAGAFLVAVPDPEGPKFPTAAASFRDVPLGPLRFPSLVVASANDPYGTLEYARSRADEWRSGFVVAGALGHINGSSGLGDWEQGRNLLRAFCAGLRNTT